MEDCPIERLSLRRILPIVSLLVWSAPRIARAQDLFEIQVYDSQVAALRTPGLEVHANFIPQGVATNGPGSLLPSDHVFHLTFEPHLGLAEWAELGGYLQTAIRPDGSYDYAGTKLRFKMRLPRTLAGHVGLAFNTEVSAVPRAYAESRFGAELRPVIDLRVGHAYFSLNPILDFDFEGELAGRPQLEPAAKAELIELDGSFGAGLEYYSALGSLSAPLGLSQQSHRLFGVVDVVREVGPLRFSMNFGVGYGFASGERWIMKSIVGVEPR